MVTPANAPTSSIGYTQGYLGTQGFFVDLAEETIDLTWPMSVRVYERMWRQDPQVRAVLNAVTLPIRRAQWAVNPASAPDNVVRTVSEDLGLPIVGDDTVPATTRERNRISWTDHVRMALLQLRYGHMGFEIGGVVEHNLFRLRTLAPRLPSTIMRINVDVDGSLLGVSQYPAGNIAQAGATAGGRDIPANRLAWYAMDREGGAWQGQSVLRAAYGPWLFKSRLMRIAAMVIERNGMGIPVAQATQPGATPKQIADAQQMASAARAGDTAGAAMPYGFELHFRGIEGQIPDAIPVIKYYDDQIAKIMLAQFLELGSSAHGSRALGGTMVDFFTLALQAIADEIAATATQDIVERLVDWNYGPDVPAPRVEVADIGTQHQATAEALSQLLQAGAITPDPALEAFVRDAFDLPARDESVPWVAPAMKTRPGSPPATSMAASLTRDTENAKIHASIRSGKAAEPHRFAKAQFLHGNGHARCLVCGRTERVNVHDVAEQGAAALSAEFRRELTSVELASKADFSKVQADWQSATEQLVQRYGKLRAAQIEQIIAQVQQAVDDDSLDELPDLNLDADGRAIIAAALTALAADGAAQAADEVRAQGVTAPTPERSDLPAPFLTSAATVAARLLARDLVGSAVRSVMTRTGPDSDGKAVAAGVRSDLEQLTDRNVTDVLGGALSAAQNAGRVAAFQGAPDATYYASEILDGGTCDPCSEIDGQQFDSLAEAQDAYASGGYVNCDGGLRCRGVIIAVYENSGQQAA